MSIAVLLLGLLLLQAPAPDSARPSVGRAVLLAGIVPGGGAFYLGKPLKGLVLAGIELVPLGLATYHYQRYHTLNDRTELQTAFGWFILFVGTKLFSMADSYVTAKLWGFREAQRLVEQDVHLPDSLKP